MKFGTDMCDPQSINPKTATFSYVVVVNKCHITVAMCYVLDPLDLH